MPKALTYCPVCGHKLGAREEAGRIRQVCPNCGYIHYVNPVPAVGIIIEQDGGVVLIQRKHPPHEGRWTLPSGYIEADESAEEAAMREAEEETGLKVEIVELMGVNSFPEGPPLSGIMIFFRARPVGGELYAGDDAADARVFPPEEMPLLPFRTHREAMAQWLAAHGKPTDGTPMPIIEADFTVRPAEAGDLNEIMALLHLIPANRDLTRDVWKEVAQRFRESPGLEIFVALDRQQPPIIVGFVALSVIRGLTEGCGLISDIAVLPTYQRRGVGTLLLEVVMKRAERLNLHRLMVNVQPNPFADLPALGDPTTRFVDVPLYKG
jgi:8-oxo-dGTP diphosphatase